MVSDFTQLQEAMHQAMLASDYADRRPVFGEGPHSPRLMMIGEAPGGEEEKQERPFVGKAGKNLTAFLETVALKREEIYISNVVKIRPIKYSPKTQKPVNRPPSKEEIRFFLPFLKQEIALVDPALIVTLGNVPLKAVTGVQDAVIGQWHGKLSPLSDGRKLFALYHPAAVIYNRALTEVYQQDLDVLRRILENGTDSALAKP